jgi:hypothetical protein
VPAKTAAARSAATRKAWLSRKRAQSTGLEGLSGTGRGKLGTKTNPVSAGGDVELAAKLLAQGKHVQLDQPKSVSTLLDRLADMVREASDKGENAPNFNLCKVSVPKTNLFCAKSKGIPRIRMPQLSGEPIPGSKADKLKRDDRGKVDLGPGFRAHLKKSGHKIQGDTVRADHLRASQNELNGPKVGGISRAITQNPNLFAKADPMFVSSDDYIVDGHHRWAAEVAYDLQDNVPGDVKQKVDRVDMSIIELLAEANRFAEEWGIPQASAKEPKKR